LEQWENKNRATRSTGRRAIMEVAFAVKCLIRIDGPSEPESHQGLSNRGSHLSSGIPDKKVDFQEALSPEDTKQGGTQNGQLQPRQMVDVYLWELRCRQEASGEDFPVYRLLP
jgi:hypothetical protein